MSDETEKIDLSTIENIHPPEPADLARLRELGWDDGWTAALRRALVAAGAVAGRDGAGGLFSGRVTRSDRGACELLAARAGRLDAVTTTWGPAVARLAARDPGAVPAAGDWVLAAWTGAGRQPTTEVILPRRTALVRAQVTSGSSYGQVLAANADVVAVVEGMVPDPDFGRLERLLALAWSSGARPLVVLTKADLVPAPQHLVDDVLALAPGALVLPVSATDGTGLEPLQALLAEGSTVALVGASGVGKSTLLNALLGREVMRTRELGAANKGRHTTVTRELHAAPGGGAVLDTPGLRSVGLVGDEPVQDVFDDIARLAAECRFADCAHTCEPGCAVLGAVQTGELPERRLASYRKLLREAEYQASRTDARLRAERAGRWKAVQRQARGRSRR